MPRPVQTVASQQLCSDKKFYLRPQWARTTQLLSFWFQLQKNGSLHENVLQLSGMAELDTEGSEGELDHANDS